MNLSSRPRILIVTSRADAGGGPGHVLQLIRGLSKDCEIFVASPPDRPYGILFLEEVGKDHFFHLPHRAFSFKALFALRAFLRRHRIDLVHSVGHGAGIYSRLACCISPVRCLHAFQGLHWRQRSFLGRIFYFSAEGFLGRLSNRLVAVSNDEKKEILRFGSAPSGKLSTIFNGVEMPAITQITRPDFNDRLRVITMTRFDFQKNTEQIADIMSILEKRDCLEQFEFHLLGDGPGRAAFEAYAEKLGMLSRLRIHGQVERPADYFVGAFACLSTARWEGLPYAVLEAMSWGIPIVATRVVGHHDCVHPGENGFLFDPSNPEEAADDLMKLREIFSWEKYSGNARRICERDYRIETMLRDYLSLYRRILSFSEN